MREEKFWQEGMDGKRFALCLFKKGWIILAAALAGAAVAAGIYLFAALVLGGKPEYQVFPSTGSILTRRNTGKSKTITMPIPGGKS